MFQFCHSWLITLLENSEMSSRLMSFSLSMSLMGSSVFFLAMSIMRVSFGRFSFCSMSRSMFFISGVFSDAHFLCWDSARLFTVKVDASL